MKSASSDNSSTGTGKLAGIFGSVIRTTVKFCRNFPSRVRNYISRKVSEYKRKPKRDSANKIYVLVGYTTKSHIDAKHNVERFMIILRSGLLAIIFVLLFFIAVNAVIPYIDFDQYSGMFGISSVDDVTKNDPFYAVAATETSAEDDFGA